MPKYQLQERWETRGFWDTGTWVTTHTHTEEQQDGQVKQSDVQKTEFHPDE